MSGRRKCPTCGIRTHKLYSIGGKPFIMPIDVAGEVQNGICLVCQPASLKDPPKETVWPTTNENKIPTVAIDAPPQLPMTHTSEPLFNTIIADRSAPNNLEDSALPLGSFDVILGCICSDWYWIEWKTFIAWCHQTYVESQSWNCECSWWPGRYPSKHCVRSQG